MYKIKYIEYYIILNIIIRVWYDNIYISKISVGFFYMVRCDFKYCFKFKDVVCC